MRYKQAHTILRQIASDRKARARTRLESIKLLTGPLPRLGGYSSGSPEALLWQLCSDEGAAPSKRLIALCNLIVRLADRKASSPSVKGFSNHE